MRRSTEEWSVPSRVTNSSTTARSAAGDSCKWPKAQIDHTLDIMAAPIPHKFTRSFHARQSMHSRPVRSGIVGVRLSCRDMPGRRNHRHKLHQTQRARPLPSSPSRPNTNQPPVNSNSPVTPRSSSKTPHVELPITSPNYSPALGEKLKIVDRTYSPPGPDASTINFSLSPGLNSLGPEGYTLIVAPQRIDIKAASPAGVFYACQTLRQMLPASFESPLQGGTPGVRDRRGNDSNVNPPTPFGGIQGVPPNPLTIPACTIEDQPRYPWRGMHLDVSRHFFPKETVKRYLDLLAAYKMNVFHWHLTDDQGWRIEIKKYPLLTSVGAWRSYNAATDGPNAPAASADGTPGQYGGFYTQDDIREIVAYAKARYINVVPEIEMPGHSNAALAAYPELSCTGGPYKSGQVWGVYKDVYCAGKDSTFDFLENVLAEVCDLFPGPYIHVGGDECPKDRWKQCPDCQQRIKTEGLKNEEELQSYFIKRIEKFLETKHHQLIGWDEILQGGLAPGAAVTSWRGIAGGRTAASQGHDVVMCPESNCYFDHTADAGSNPQGSGAFLFVSPVPLSKVYAFEPTPADLAPDQARHIMGAQGNVWTERIPTQDRLDYMAFPRASPWPNVYGLPIAVHTMISRPASCKTSNASMCWESNTTTTRWLAPSPSALGSRATKSLPRPKISISR